MPCDHNDTQRAFTGTWTTEEIKTATLKGSDKILKIYELWHFEKTSSDLFKGYIRRFMKIKLEPSKYNFITSCLMTK